MNIINYFKTLDQKLLIAIIILLLIIVSIGIYIVFYYINTNANTNHNENFELAIDDIYNAQIVLYYTSWCGYSRQFLPEWIKFEKYAEKNFPSLKVTRINCESENEILCQQRNIIGYPSVILYPKNDTEIIFDGPRNSTGIIEFVKNNIKF